MSSLPVQESKEVTLQDKVMEDLRSQIENGGLVPHQRLPSLTALAQQYGVSDITIRAAVKKLVSSGHLYSRRGSGVFVQNELPLLHEPNASMRDQRTLKRLMGDVVAVLSQMETPLSSTSQVRGNVGYIGQGAIAAAQRMGMHALTLHPDKVLGDASLQGEIEWLTEIHPYGVVIPDTVHARVGSLELAQALSGRGLPLVVYGDSETLAGFDRVASDHEEGSYLLTRWLIDNGRKRLLNLWPSPATNYWFAQSQSGYERAMKESGLPTLEPALFPWPKDQENEDGFNQQVEQISSILQEYLTGSEPVDGILLSTDSDVFRTSAALRRLGVKPNEDVALVGYDNYWAEANEREWETVFPLATVDKQNLEIGAALVQLLKERVNGQLPSQPQRRVIKPTLIIT